MQQSQSSRYSSQSWFTRLRLYYVLLVILILGLMQNIHAETVLEIDSKTLSNKCTIEILNTQVVKAGGNLAVVPQTGWEQVTLPDNWENRWNHYTGSAWYKINWKYQCKYNNLPHPFALLIERINLAGIVYNNGELIWRDKSLVEPLSRSWNMPRYWVLPSSSLNEQSNEILVRVVGLETQNSGLGAIHIGEVDEITNLHESLIFERRTLFLINIIICSVLGVTAFLIWLLRRQEVAYGWFALNCIFWSLFICNILILSPFPFLDSMMHARLNLVFFLGYSYTFCLFLLRFSNSRIETFEKILLIIAVSTSVILLFTPITYLKSVLVFAFIYSCLIFLLNCFIIQWIAYKKSKLDIYLLAGVFLSFIIICIHDLIIIFPAIFQSYNLKPFMWTPLAAPITSIMISFILAWRIARNMRHIEKFNQTLEDTVERVSFDLEQSLVKKHHLQLDNMRLQERLNLSHELHDGLGGSIVRSMILLEHAEVVEKKQVLSMFKLLRSDLRQVIDSGSSLGVKIPESPVMWVAPLRHRFVQLFEEMNIESTWIFSNSWIIKPPPLHCLTLSRVAEEALTNIIKHSNATDVEVSLTENDLKNLILEIKDNGTGFQVNAVEQGLHVGLQSMQVRIKRIGGAFEISSEAGLTVIRVILPMKI